MPTSIAPSKAHQSQRLAYQPRGWPLANMERSHKAGSGLRRVTISGRTRATMDTKRISAIALGLIVANQSAKALSAEAENRITGDAFSKLKAIMNTSEMTPQVPANTIGFSRFAGRK